MADPMDPLRKSPSTSPEEKKIEPTRNDPTPDGRRGDSRFLPVVIVAAVTLIVLLIAAVVLIRGKGHKMIPQDQDRPTSSLSMQPPTADWTPRYASRTIPSSVIPLRHYART
jgi:cell division protein FtsN